MISQTREHVLEVLAQGNAEQLRGADLRGLDLTRLKFAFVSLEGTQFDGADLSGSLFQHADLSGTSFRQARLDKASMRYIRANGTNFNGLHAIETDWNWSNLVGADFTFATLKKTRFLNSSLDRVTFDGANLTLGSLSWSMLDGASFRETNLLDVETLGASFRDADLKMARNFAYCREIVLEILMREADESLETMQWLGAATLLRQWCYPVWAELLRGRSELERMIRIFQQYPHSGCMEALHKPFDANTHS